MSYLNTARLLAIDSVFNFAVHHLHHNRTPLRNLLDLGCAEGFYTHKLSRINSAYVVGIDLSMTRIKRANRRKRCNEDFLVCDAENLPFRDEVMEIILCSEILEHLPNPNSCLHEAYRTLTKNGKLILTTPSSKSFVETRSIRTPMLSIACDLESIAWSIARKIYRLVSNTKKVIVQKVITKYEGITLQKFIECFEHLNPIDRTELVQMLHQSNMEIEIFRWSGFYAPFVPIRILLSICPSIVKKLEKVLAIVKPEPFLWTMVVLCRKRCSPACS